MTTFIGSEATVNNMNKRVWHKKSEYLLGQMPTVVQITRVPAKNTTFTQSKKI